MASKIGFVEWQDSFELGYQPLDDSRRFLVESLNDLSRALGDGDYSEGGRLSLRFINAARRHFAREEDILEAIEFPGREDHKAHHGKLITTAKNLEKLCQDDPDPEDVNRGFLELTNMLLDDVIQSDQDFRDYLPRG